MVIPEGFVSRKPSQAHVFSFILRFYSTFVHTWRYDNWLWNSQIWITSGETLIFHDFFSNYIIIGKLFRPRRSFDSSTFHPQVSVNEKCGWVSGWQMVKGEQWEGRSGDSTEIFQKCWNFWFESPLLPSPISPFISLSSWILPQNNFKLCNRNPICGRMKDLPG
jgi:hypothetical protein